MRDDIHLKPLLLMKVQSQIKTLFCILETKKKEGN
jgi:hypothetical protein